MSNLSNTVSSFLIFCFAFCFLVFGLSWRRLFYYYSETTLVCLFVFLCSICLHNAILRVKW